jgi:ribonuclease P protein component
VGRVGGSAVRRNRIRRRLRAAMRQAEARGDVTPGSYLVGAGPEVMTMPFPELEHTLAELLTTARRDGAGAGA